MWLNVGFTFENLPGNQNGYYFIKQELPTFKTGEIDVDINWVLKYFNIIA
jgi:hypothetical protein